MGLWNPASTFHTDTSKTPRLHSLSLRSTSLCGLRAALSVSGPVSDVPQHFLMVVAEDILQLKARRSWSSHNHGCW